MGKRKHDVTRNVSASIDAIYEACEELANMSEDVRDAVPVSGRKAELWSLADSLMEYAGKQDKSLYRRRATRIMARLDRHFGNIMPLFAARYKGPSQKAMSRHADNAEFYLERIERIIRGDGHLMEYLSQGDYPHLKRYLDIDLRKKA